MIMTNLGQFRLLRLVPDEELRQMLRTIEENQQSKAPKGDVEQFQGRTQLDPKDQKVPNDPNGVVDSPPPPPREIANSIPIKSWIHLDRCELALRI